MNGKLQAGSILSGLGVLAAVINGWAPHVFYALFHIARAETLEATSTFDPSPYGSGPETTQLFVGTRILLWGVIVGVALVLWGVMDELTGSESV